MIKIINICVIALSFWCVDSWGAVKYSLQYKVIIPAQPNEGKIMNVWVPFPAENSVQTVSKMAFNVSDAVPFVRVKQEKKYGNKMAYSEIRTSKKPIELSFEYEIERSVDDGSRKKDPYVNPKIFGGPDKWVPIFSEIQVIASRQVKNMKMPSQKVRAFYDYVVNTMTYDKSGEGWGRGDAVWACTTKRGNCTDFHSLFIALNRSEGIPARFEIGFPIPSDKEEGEIPGYHCWAQAYTKDKGWIPVDASEAKKTGKVEEYYGKLPPNRIEFSRGRDIVLNPPQKGEPLNYFIYPYAEVEGISVSGIEKKFHFKKLGDSL